MIRVVATARSAALASDDIITSGSVGIPVVFELSEDFEGLACTAVFRGSGAARDVALIDGTTCVVPAECLAEAGGVLRIGIYASNAGGTVVIPTVWASSRPIEAGTEPSEYDPAGPSPSWSAQVQAAAAEALRKAQNVQERADAGEFDGDPGISPSVTVTAIPGGHRVTITDAEGTRDFYVLNGPGGRGIASAVLNADYTLTLTYTDGTAYTTPSLRGSPGEDGYSPRASVSKSGKAATITITDKQGTTTATVSDGEDGAPGISPTITVTDITGGHRVTITDADGAHSFDVMDGDAADAPVQDVQVNGASVVADGVAEIPVANSLTPGVIRVNASRGFEMDGSYLTFKNATDVQLRAGTNQYRPITPSTQLAAAFYGLAKAAGDATQSASSNTVGNYTDNAKIAIQKMLGIYEAPWELIREDTFTNATEADHVISVDGNGQAFELTDIRMQMWFPTQENEAKFESGVFTFYDENNNVYTCACDRKTVSANSASCGAFAFVSQEPGMVLLQSTGWHNNSVMGTMRIVMRMDTSEAGYPFKVTQNEVAFTSVSLKKVTGTLNYRIYGKRKWRT